MNLSTLFEFDFVMKGEGIPDCCLYTYKMLYIYICIYAR